MTICYEELETHVGHTIECVTYADVMEISVECVTCNEVIVAVNKEAQGNE